MYDPYEANHACYGAKIHILHCNDMVFPHYIKFDFNFNCHEHYVLEARDKMGFHTGHYSWPLQAASCEGPAPESPPNDNLTVFYSTHPTLLAIDIALHTLADPGVMADVD